LENFKGNFGGFLGKKGPAPFGGGFPPPPPLEKKSCMKPWESSWQCSSFSHCCWWGFVVPAVSSSDVTSGHWPFSNLGMYSIIWYLHISICNDRIAALFGIFQRETAASLLLSHAQNTQSRLLNSPCLQGMTCSCQFVLLGDVKVCTTLKIITAALHMTLALGVSRHYVCDSVPVECKRPCSCYFHSSGA